LCARTRCRSCFPSSPAPPSISLAAGGLASARFGRQAFARFGRTERLWANFWLLRLLDLDSYGWKRSPVVNRIQRR
jgi:hypothetical protein